MAKKHKGTTKKTRFEVFKRDSFKCQHCGRSAPDVILVVDHIQPVAKGGDNDIVNLITSCEPCNAGKSDRTLDDQSTLAKQRQQLQELNERREQLEMMLQWKQGLVSVKEDALDKLVAHWDTLTPGWRVNESGRQVLRKLTRRFSFEEILDGMAAAADQYLEISDGKPTGPSVANAWRKIGATCFTTKASKGRPHLRGLYYIRAILRNRVYVNEKNVMPQLEEAVSKGADVEEMKNLAKHCASWTEFWEEVESLKNETL